MNGLNSLGLHVGVELIFLLAEVIGVLKELSCDWSDGLGGCGRTLSMVEVGYFVTMFIVDISVGLPWVWVRSGEPFTTAARGFAAPDRVSHHPKPEKAHKTSERNLLLYIFFLSQTFFLFVWLFVCFLKVTACVNERPCHFLLTTYLRFCVAFARLCSISKDLLARWKAQQRQRSHKGKRDACVVKFPRGIFSWYWPERRRTGFYSDSRRARGKKGGTKRKEKKERERALNAAFDLQGDQGTVVEATDLLHYSFHPFHSPALLVLSPPFSEHRLSDGPASQRPKLHQSRGFVLRGRPDGTLHESVHPLHHRHTLRALLATGGDRGGTEEETVAKTQSPKRETRSATQRNVSKHERNALQLNVFSKRGVFG